MPLASIKSTKPPKTQWKTLRAKQKAPKRVSSDAIKPTMGTTVRDRKGRFGLKHTEGENHEGLPLRWTSG